MGIIVVGTDSSLDSASPIRTGTETLFPTFDLPPEPVSFGGRVQDLRPCPGLTVLGIVTVVNVTVGELMTPEPMTVTEPLGIVTASDMLDGGAEATTVASFMSTPVYSVASTEGPHVAARIMRNHHLHHVVVVDHHRVVGMVSTFDLLSLVEDHRYQAKQPPTRAAKSPKRQ